MAALHDGLWHQTSPLPDRQKAKRRLPMITLLTGTDAGIVGNDFRHQNSLLLPPEGQVPAAIADSSHKQ